MHLQCLVSRFEKIKGEQSKIIGPNVTQNQDSNSVLSASKCHKVSQLQTTWPVSPKIYKEDTSENGINMD